jgi:hypothetical protein
MVIDTKPALDPKYHRTRLTPPNPSGWESPHSFALPPAQRPARSKHKRGEGDKGDVYTTSRTVVRCALLVLFITRPVLAQVQKVIDLAHDDLVASDYVAARTSFVVVMRNRAPAAKYQSVMERAITPIPPLPTPTGNKILIAGIDCTSLEGDIVALDQLKVALGSGRYYILRS